MGKKVERHRQCMAVFAMLFKQELGMALAQKIDATLGVLTRRRGVLNHRQYSYSFDSLEAKLNEHCRDTSSNRKGKTRVARVGFSHTMPAKPSLKNLENL